MRLAKSFRQPTASLICEGLCHTITAAAYTAHRGELLIFASSLGRPGMQPIYLRRHGRQGADGGLLPHPAKHGQDRLCWVTR